MHGVFYHALVEGPGVGGAPLWLCAAGCVPTLCTLTASGYLTVSSAPRQVLRRREPVVSAAWEGEAGESLQSTDSVSKIKQRVWGWGLSPLPTPFHKFSPAEDYLC